MPEPSKKRVRFTEQADDVAGPSDAELINMSRRRDKYIDQDDQDTSTAEEGTSDRADYTKKHTIDSDDEEEDEQDKHKRLDMNTVEGQEDRTIDFDGHTKITPFNMDEEMEEGHFDSTGTFIFNKKGEDVHDAWLDGIDWGNVKRAAGDQWERKDNYESDEDDDTFPGTKGIDSDKLMQSYNSLLTMLRPEETILKCLRRLGGNKSAAEKRKERWAAVKAAKATGDGSKPVVASDEQNVVDLTEIADMFVSKGEFEAYQWTFEKVELMLKTLEDEKSAKPAADPGLDMFGDEVPQSSNAPVEISEPKSTIPEAKSEANNPIELGGSGIKWVFKWEEKTECELHGPYSSEHMQSWAEEGYFKNGVFVKRVDRDDDTFFPSSRIDFELYI